MKKEKIIIKDTEIEPRDDGITVVRVTLTKGSKEYIRGARYTDLLDPKNKQSIFRTWKKDIEKVEEEKAINEDEIEANIAALKGEEIPDE